MKKGDVRGLYIPLITPMRYQQFDAASMQRVLASVDPFVDGYVPCLSSGEGQFLSREQWNKVVRFVRSQTAKPVIAGVKRDTYEELLELAKDAADIGCDAIIVPVPKDGAADAVNYFTRLSQDVATPVMIYNTETDHIDDPEVLQAIDALPNVIAIKDSSLKASLFEAMCAMRREGTLHMNVLQGMEHMLDMPEGADGALVSILNIHPELTRKYLDSRDPKLNKELLRLFLQENLGGDWYITLKAILKERGTIRSAEQVQQFITVDPEVLRELQQETSDEAPERRPSELTRRKR